MNYIEFDESIRKYFNLTHEEYLFSQLTYKRLLEILRVNTTGPGSMQIVDFSRSTNSFGEFRFITLKGRTKNTMDQEMPVYLTAYGHGYNECRDCEVSETWNFYIGFTGLFTDHLPPCHTIKLLEDEHNVFVETEPKNKKFAMLEAFGDPDEAYSEVTSE